MKSENNSKVIKKTAKKISITKFKDLEGQFLHVKVGDANTPAIDDQISDIQKEIVRLFEENNINCVAFVTHHAVSINIIEKEN